MSAIAIAHPNDWMIDPSHLAAAADHACRCSGCDPSLDTRSVYGDIDGRTTEDHLAVRFGDWVGGKDNPDWEPIKLDGTEIRLIFEVDKHRGVIWAYREPLHICVTCIRAGRTETYGVCAERRVGIVSFGD